MSENLPDETLEQKVQPEQAPATDPVAEEALKELEKAASIVEEFAKNPLVAKELEAQGKNVVPAKSTLEGKTPVDVIVHTSHIKNPA